MILYNDTMDADRQVTAEEKIASHLFEHTDYDGSRLFTEDAAAVAGRAILKQVLIEFRPDLFVPSHWVCPKCHKTQTLEAADVGKRYSTDPTLCKGPCLHRKGFLCYAEMVLIPKGL